MSTKPTLENSNARPCEHPTSIADFEKLYAHEYRTELESSDRWIEWAKKQNDWYGVNFHQGMRSALVFQNIKMGQLLRILKQEAPNAAQAATPAAR